MDVGYELSLAQEGERGSALSEDQWIAWEEKLALAPGIAAKKELVLSTFGATTPDVQYRTALLTLLEVQELLDSKSHEDDEKADALMVKQRPELLTSERELREKSYYTKAKRISHRRAVLELEVAMRLRKSEAKIQELARAVATEMGFTLSDSPPANVDSVAATETPLQTRLSEEAISTEAKLFEALALNQYFDDEGYYVRRMEETLDNMDVYARELLFVYVANETSGDRSAASIARSLLGGVLGKQTTTTNSTPVKLSAEKRWWILELFLGDYAFEYAHVDGYLDVIVEDLKKKKKDGDKKTFGSRKAHERLSLVQLNGLLEKEPGLFRSDPQFALRYIALMRSVAKIEQASELNAHGDVQRAAKIATAESCLTALNGFSASANPLRAALLHEQLKELQYKDANGLLKTKFFQYLQLPRFGADFANPSFIGSARADELVLFSEPSYYYRSNASIQPTTTVRVEQISQIISDSRVNSSDDLRLIKSILYLLWSSDQLTEDDDKLLRKYLTNEFVDEEKAECMVVSGCGELSVWKAKLLRKGEELSEWSSKTEISFCESNASQFGPNDELEFFVNVRNVKTLTVQVYEVRTIDYYTRLRREVQGNISLDGLLPNEEQRIDLSHLAPWQKSRVHVKLSPNAVGRRGVFVVEVFEKDTTCRAILRKGYLRHVERVTSRGHEFTVLDERGVVLKDASLQLMNLKDGNSKAQPPRAFHPMDGSGVIVIPFRQPGESASDSFGIVFQHDDFGYLLRPFDYSEAAFTLTADMYIDAEQLRPGEEATMLARPLLSVGSGRKHSVPIDMLTDIKATISFASVNKSSSAGVSHKVVQSFGSVKELMDGRCTFPIPLDADGLTVEISARVKSNSSEAVDLRRLPVVTSSKTFVVQRVTQFETTFTPHFLRRPMAAPSPNTTEQFEYYIAVLGHNGEPIQAKQMKIAIKHLHFNTAIQQNLQTDAHGEIRLGELAFVTKVAASFAGSYVGPNLWSWELPNLRTYSPQTINCAPHESIRIPLPHAAASYVEEWLQSGLITLCRVLESPENVATPVLEATEANLSTVKNSNGEVISVAFTVARPGIFLLYVRPLDVKFPITVVSKKLVDSPAALYGSILVQQKKILLATSTSPLTVMSHRVEVTPASGKAWLHLELDQARPETTHVWVVLKRFLSQSNAALPTAVMANSLSHGGGHYFVSDLAFDSTILDSEYLKKRKISDEYTYILQRRAFLRANSGSMTLIGTSSLPQPTLIQTPHVIDTSDLEELTMRDGEKVSGFKTRESASISRLRPSNALHSFASVKGGRGGGGGREGVSSISFLAGGSAVVGCPAISSVGVASVCLSDIPLYSEAAGSRLELVIMAFDSESGHVTSLESQIGTQILAGTAAPKRDVRLSPEEALDEAKPSMQIQRHEVLKAGENRVLPRTFSSKYALYETLGSAMDLWATLCTDAEIPDLVEQLKKWPSMKLKDKLAFYSKNACDDLNFFLFRKDRTFFDAHAKPFVSAKLSKSLIDLIVLEDTLTIQQRYTHPGIFQHLSVIEKLLVAQRAGSAEQKEAMCQHVIDVIDGAIVTNRVPGRQLSSIFDTVLSQGAVKPGPVVEEVEEEESVVSASYAAYSYEEQPSPPGGFGSSAQMDWLKYMDTRAMPTSSMAFGAAPAPAPQMRSMMRMAMPMSKMKKSSAAPSSQSDDEDDDDDISEGGDDSDDDDFGVESLDSEAEEDEASAVDGKAQDDNDSSEQDRQARKREIKKRRAQPYLLAGKVRRVQEKRFFKSQTPHLDGRNRFWRDYATHLAAASPAQAFLSSHFPEALQSFTEGILAISVLELATSDVTPTTVRLLAGSNRVQLDAVASVVLYHQGIGPGTVSEEPNSTLIIKQRLVSQADRASAQSKDFADIRPVREFIANRIYSCVVSVSNIGSKRLRDVNLLMQIPRGAIPLTSSSFYTKNEVVEVAPHDTKTLSFDFYFPDAGQFTQYPAHASVESKVVAWASTDDELTKPITVVLKATAVDLTSWRDVAARGSLDDVVSFLNKEKAILDLGLNDLAWRCVERDFYNGLVQHLRQRWVFVQSIWKYAFLHDDVDGMQETISANRDFLRALGHGVHTSVVQLSSSIYYQERFDASFSFDHTEFGPLLSRRAHRVSGKVSSGSSAFNSSSGEVAAASSDNEPARILHKQTREYYRTLCQTLSLRASLDAEQLLVVTYFLILFHRIEDALAVFDRAKALEASAMRDTTELSIAADYMDAYLDFFRVSTRMDVQYPIARRNTAKYAKLANDRWRERFMALQDVLDERDELRAAALAAEKQRASSTQSATATDVKGSLAAQRIPDDDEVRLTAEVKGDEVHLTSQNLGACEISFYRIDVELMFSTEPFDSFSDSAASKSSLLLIKPYQQRSIELKTDAQAPETTVWKMPTELAASPMLLRIREAEASRTVSTIAPPVDLSRSYFNSDLQVIITKQAGFVQVLYQGNPVWSCYVKVYAKVSGAARGKQTQFYKDGYTDVIGKFDYAAVNGDLLTRVEKFSILVSHPTHGTTVQQVAPPVLAVTSSEFTDREAREALWY